MSRLADKTAIVLGAAGAGNMGQVIAKAFSEEGAKVVVAGRNEAELDKIAAQIGGSAVRCDITDHSDLQRLADGVVSSHGKVDVAVNAVGWGLSSSLLEIEDADLRKMVDIQFIGTHYFLSEIVRVMKDNDPQGGSIIQISSATTQALINNYAAYIGTKTGSDALIRCVANDFGQYGIKANSISPALTKTPMTEGSFGLPGLVDAFLPRYPLGRLNTSEDIAKTAIWLASDDAYITGQNIQANGGLTLRGNPQAAEVGASIAAATASAPN